ncbi:cytochrome c3 family protein [soil metagenome]
MANFFPRWTNTVLLKVAVCLGVVGIGTVAAVSYYFTPEYTRVGYQPSQPVPFSHKLHAGQLGMDCRYCHNHVESSAHSNIPSSQTCWNCHQHVKKESPRLEPIRRSIDKTYEGYTGEPVEWVRVHKVPEYAYFDHSAHVNRGVSCVSCHGKINEMSVVYQHESQSMGWCLDCHRAPEKNLRPLDQITNLDWKPEDLDREQFYGHLLESGTAPDAIVAALGGGGGGAEAAAGNPGALAALAREIYGEKVVQKEVGTVLKNLWSVNPPENCTGCHR